MISTNQFKNGTHIEVDGTIFRIVDFQHVKPGKGGAFVRTKLRKIEDGTIQDKTFRAGEKFRPVRTENHKMQYLYDSGEAAVFMDNQSYEQVELQRPARRRDAVGPAQRRGRGALRRRATLGSRSRARWTFRSPRPIPESRATPRRAAEPSRPRSRPAVVVEVPLFINESESVRVDTAPASTSGAPNPRPG